MPLVVNVGNGVTLAL